MKPQAAQNQHYVPKFILRNFLFNKEKEQVNVFSKRKKKGFVTSIKNIMAERRFHDFSIEKKYIASFEDSMSKIEQMVLPCYQKILDDRRIDGVPEQRAYLSLFIAFQLVRTRSFRERFEDFDRLMAERFGSDGLDINSIDGYEPLDDSGLKILHIRTIRESMGEFAQIICEKDLVLLQARKGRNFYLSDNPVNLFNSYPQEGPYGNMGLMCRGIEIYVPLSSDLALAAWCPSILDQIRHNIATFRNMRAICTISPGKVEYMKTSEFSKLLENYNTNRIILQNYQDGTPISCTDENMDYHNSLQMSQSREFVICKNGDFDLAKRFAEEHPNSRGSLLSLA